MFKSQSSVGVEGVEGVDGIMQAYDSVTNDPSITMSGPTYFAPILDRLINSIDPSKKFEY